MKQFGATIRALREKKGISLRKFAEAVEISPTYQSKVERDEFAPPGEETIRRMARLLEQNEDELLGLAGKVSSDLDEIVQQRPQLMADFLRMAGKLTDEQIKKEMKRLDKIK